MATDLSGQRFGSLVAKKETRLRGYVAWDKAGGKH